MIERKNEIAKQQIKLLIGKTILAWWTEVIPQAFIHLNDQLVGPIAPYARSGTLAKIPNTIKVGSLRRQTLPWFFCAAGNTEPHHAWKRHYLLELAMGCPIGMGELLHTSGWGGTTQSPPGSCSPAASWTYWNILFLEWNTCHWKGGRNLLAHPTPSPSFHAWQSCLPWPTCMLCITRSNS